MSVRKTISESKGFFHHEFPFVIPSIYRKVIDEYLVELNLLSNQESFKIDGFFCYGLTKSFSTYIQGYQPEKHKDMILSSLCKACSIDYLSVKDCEKKMLSIAKADSINIFIDEIMIKESEVMNKADSKQLIPTNNYYSRLHAIGIYELLNESQIKGVDEEEKVEKSAYIATQIGFKSERVQKDLNQYKNNLKRIKEAFELIRITNEETKRRAQD